MQWYNAYANIRRLHMQTKTRALRLSDEAWNMLLVKATKNGFRGRAEYLEQLLTKKKEQPVDSHSQSVTVEDTTLAVQNHRPVRAVPKPDKK
jgi:hypothetical protein